METIKKILEWLKTLKPAGKISIPLLVALLVIGYLFASCSTVGWISNVPNSNASISITNTPSTSADVAPIINPNN